MTNDEFKALSFEKRMEYLRSLPQNKGVSDKRLEVYAARSFPHVQEDIPYRYHACLADYLGDPEAYVGSKREAREVARKKGLEFI